MLNNERKLCDEGVKEQRGVYGNRVTINPK